MLWRKPPEDLAKVGVEGSNPFARSISYDMSKCYEGPPLGGSAPFGRWAAAFRPLAMGPLGGACRDGRSPSAPATA